MKGAYAYVRAEVALSLAEPSFVLLLFTPFIHFIIIRGLVPSSFLLINHV